MLKIFSVFAAPLAFLLAMFLFQSSSHEDHSVFFMRGESLYETMKRDGSFGNPIIFQVLDKIDGLKGRIDTGEYILSKRDSAVVFLSKMISRNKVIRKITFPEGYTVKMIVEKLNQNNLLRGEIRECPVEGSVMPDTYYYQFGDTRASIINKMKNNMTSFLGQIERGNKTKFTTNQIVTIASIVEKETGSSEEMGLVASVFHNRLSKNMRLQSCPTVIYAISDKYGKIDRSLTKNDLFFQSEFNTYRKNGLPPTPICCPGKRAIQASMNPPRTNFLYFVADGSNESHRFSKDYVTHKENIKWRKREIDFSK